MAPISNNDRPLEIARVELLLVHPYGDAGLSTNSKNLTSSTSDFPILHTDQINTRSIERDRIASISACSPERRS